MLDWHIFPYSFPTGLAFSEANGLRDPIPPSDFIGVKCVNDRWSPARWKEDEVVILLHFPDQGYIIQERWPGAAGLGDSTLVLLP